MHARKFSISWKIIIGSHWHCFDVLFCFMFSFGRLQRSEKLDKASQTAENNDFWQATPLCVAVFLPFAFFSIPISCYIWLDAFIHHAKCSGQCLLCSWIFSVLAIRCAKTWKAMHNKNCNPFVVEPST